MRVFFLGCKSFVEHLEIGLVADSARGGEHARLGYVFRIELNCRSWCDASNMLSREPGGRTGAPPPERRDGEQ